MQLRTIGGHTVSAIGLGGLPLSIEGRPEEDRSIATIHAALDAGITFIDTADGYHREANEVGHNEELSARALRECGSGADGVLVAATGGQLCPGNGTWPPNGDPEYLKRAAKESTRPGRAVRRLAGARSLISSTRHARYSAVASCRCRTNSRPRSAPASASAGAAPGSASHSCHGAHLAASRTPRTWPTATARSEVADEVGASVYQVTLAWEIALAPVVIPIPGASRPDSIRDSAGAADLVLTAEQLARLSA